MDVPFFFGQLLVNAVTGQVARPFGKAVKAQKRGNHEANCSDNRPIGSTGRSAWENRRVGQHQAQDNHGNGGKLPNRAAKGWRYLTVILRLFMPMLRKHIAKEELR